MAKKSKSIFKYLIGLFTVIGLRLLPHPPNVEPIMSTMMPFAKKWGVLGGMLFTIIAMLSFDLITSTLGVWSIMTITSYAVLGALAGLFFKKRESSIMNYVMFSIMGTILYDAITGIGTGMLFFNQTFIETFLGQIPFTLYHLAGNIVLSAIISPVLYKWVLNNPKIETQYILNKVKSNAVN